jgi:hypothetical protein
MSNKSLVAAIVRALSCLCITACIGTSSPSDGGTDAPAVCPSSEPIQGGMVIPTRCEQSMTCDYGAESCCGHTYPSTHCICLNGTFLCGATDACYGARCEDASSR